MLFKKLNFDDKSIIENSVPFQIEDADLHKDMTLTGYFINSEEKVTLSVSKTATIIESDGTEVVVAIQLSVSLIQQHCGIELKQMLLVR